MLAPQVLVQPSSRAPSRLQEHLEAEAAAAAAAEGGLGDDSDSALAAADGDDASERADEAGAPEDAAGAAPQPRPPSQAQQRGSGGGGGGGKGAASAGRHAHAHALANGTGPGPAAGNGLHAPRGRAPRDSRSSEDEDFDDDFADADHLHQQQQQQQRGRRAGPARRGGFWGQSRPPSPGGSALDMGDPAAAGDAALRPKSRADGAANMAASKYSNLSYWRARKVTFYRNGDPFFPGVEFRFKPGRDISSIEAMLDKLSLRMDLPRGARYLFSMDGERRLSLEELEDGGSYVVSSYKTFKPASYGKKNGTWYTTSSGQNPGWSKPPMSRKASIAEADIPPPGGGSKPSSGRVIRIINSMDHTVQCRVLLNLRTSQPFEEVLDDLGQVLKMSGAKRMYTVSGQEVRSFSQLRNEFADVDTFYLSCGGRDSPRRSRSRAGAASTTLVEDARDAVKARRARSKSRPRVVYADPAAGGKQYAGSPPPPLARGRARALSHQGPLALTAAAAGDAGGGDDADGCGAGGRRGSGGWQPRGGVAVTGVVEDPDDYTLLEVLKEEPIRVTIRGLRRTFYPPLHHPPTDNAPPEKRLQLGWVYGYRGTDSRRNLWVLPTGELLYYVAAVAVLYDRDEESQRHYIGHTEDIQCMDLHPSREMVASGQRAGRNRKTQAHIRIWSTETLLTLYVFGMSEFEVGVSAVAFSQMNGGTYVLAVDGGRERILSVWQWQWGHLLGKVATLQDELTGAVFHPLDDNLLITHGKGHLTFWTRRKDGFFERTDIIKPPTRTNITSIQFEMDGDVVTADGDGFITIYSVDSDGAYFVRLEFEAHTKGISSLIMLSEGTLLSGGEKDRKIIAWDSLQNYKKITETKLPEPAGGVRSIYPQRPGRNDGNIYVGTTRNNILEGSLQRRFNQIVFGHSRQLWALAVHPDDELFATGGHDKNIALWRRNKLVWTTQVAYEVVSLSFHPFGVALAAGSTEGHLIVLNAESGQPVATVRVCGSPLSCVAYNPGGDTIAVGSQNGSIYLFRVSRDGFSYKKSNKIRGSQPLTQMDWSTDGGFIQTTTADYDLVFWDVKALQAEKSAVAMKDIKWYSHNSTVGFLVAGIWNNRYYPMTSLIITGNRSAAHDLLVTGDADGYLRLFRYPCLSPKAEYNEEKVYSLQIAAARFLFNDKNVVTVGGTDASLMLWDVVDD